MRGKGRSKYKSFNIKPSNPKSVNNIRSGKK